MLNHEFFSCNYNEIPDKSNTNNVIGEYSNLQKSKKKKSKSAIIHINDDIIQKHHNLFLDKSNFKTYNIDLRIMSEGLNYYGISIIPTKEINNFKRNLQQISDYPNIKELIILCDNTINNNKYIIHFGI